MRFIIETKNRSLPRRYLLFIPKKEWLGYRAKENSIVPLPEKKWKMLKER